MPAAPLTPGIAAPTAEIPREFSASSAMGMFSEWNPWSTLSQKLAYVLESSWSTWPETPQVQTTSASGNPMGKRVGFTISGSHSKGKVTPSCRRDVGSSDLATRQISLNPALCGTRGGG